MFITGVRLTLDNRSSEFETLKKKYVLDAKLYCQNQVMILLIS